MRFGLCAALAVLLCSCRTAPTIEPKPFAALIKKPVGGSYNVSGSVSGHCGRRTDLHIVQVQVDDIHAAALGISRFLKKYTAMCLAPGCSFTGRWSGGIGAFDYILQATRWVSTSQLDEAATAAAQLGTLQYANTAPGQGKYDADVVRRLEASREKLMDPQINKNPLERRILKDEIAELEPQAASYLATADKSLLHVLVVSSEKRHDYTEEPSALPAESPFARVSHLLKSGSIDQAQRAAAWLNNNAATSKSSSGTGGVGLRLGVRPDGVYIDEVIPDMPADAAGAKPGFKIITIDTSTASGNDPNAVRALIIGPVGTSVSLKIRSPEGVEKQLTIRRAALAPDRDQFHQVVQGCLEHSDKWIRKNCLRAKATVDPDSESTIGAIVRALKDGDPTVRTAAVELYQGLLDRGMD